MTDAVTNPIEYLKAHVVELAEQRKTYEEQKALAATLDIQLQRTDLYKQYVEAKSELLALKMQLDLADSVVREDALNIFDGENKKIADGVSIIDTTTVELQNDVLIIAWAIEHSRKSLSYKKGEIKKIAKVMDVEGTEVVEGNAVRIVSDLSAYLDG